ncbi:MAG: hypothetical protein FD161_3280 [Limisphaerales bacterium]|nr:MAG: hypothetical protein FD161_3280 [Limisphaerales bacterium]KAG0507888.1 MAG: hypothetical protein E1N63_2946 [Limisphaerales bacterium]TXT49985.1 MAG: hypothetical protein FD140_2671 [Limisphaerales bacterium]
MSESVTIKFQYSAEEYARGIRLHYESRDFTPGVVAVIGCIEGGLWLWAGRKFDKEGLLWMAVMTLTVALMLYKLFVVPRLVFRSNPKLAAAYEFTFSPDEVHVRTQDIDSRLQWSFYTGAVVGEGFFLLYSGKQAFTAIPKRAFPDPDTLQAFDNLLARFVSNITRLA